MSALGQDLINASKAGDLSKVTGILRNKPGSPVVDAVDGDGLTVLIWAASQGHLEVVKFLLQTRADREKRDKEGNTALMWAAWMGLLEVVKVLVQAGADWEKQNKFGQTALMWAAADGHVEVVKFLVQAGADRKKEDWIGDTALMLAAEKDRLEVVKVLVQAERADREKRNTKEGQKALNLARSGATKQPLRNPPPHPAPTAATLPTAPPPPAPSSSQPTLLAECERVLQQAACAPQRRDLTQRLRTLQTQLQAAEAAENFESVASLGLTLTALQQQSAQLPLSEEDHLTLSDRHAALVQRVTEQCREFTRTRSYAALGLLSAKLKELKALDLAGIAGTREEGASGANGPVVVAVVSNREDDGANDPVVVSSARS